MQLHNYNQLLENSSNLSFKYREIEVPTRSSFTVDDCIVIERETENLKQELVYYVVPSRIFLAVQSYQELWQDAQRVLAGLKKLGLKTFAFSLICDRAFDINRNNWDLSSMKFVINSEEPIVTKVARNLVSLVQEIRTQIVNNLKVNPDYLIPVDKEIIPKTATQLSQRFNAGEFKVIIKRIDILLGNANSIPG